MFQLRSEITNVSVVNSNPLVLSVDVKAITSRTTMIDGVTIFDNNQTIVAQTDFDDCEQLEHKDFTGFGLAVLPGGSEVNVNLTFSTVLSSGNYAVCLATWHGQHDSSHFTIP